MSQLCTASRAHSNDRKPWTRAEDEYLRAQCANLSIRLQALVLSRSQRAVELRRRRLGIRIEPAPQELPTLAALRDRISAQENPFLSLLGWRHADLEG
jgi:hypothetical protein